MCACNYFNVKKRRQKERKKERKREIERERERERKREKESFFIPYIQHDCYYDYYYYYNCLNVRFKVTVNSH